MYDNNYDHLVIVTYIEVLIQLFGVWELTYICWFNTIKKNTIKKKIRQNFI